MKIDRGTTVRGSFQVEGDLVVEGTLEGKVFVSGRLEIAASGVLTGEATCSGGAIQGRISGIVHSGEPVSVASEAVVSGRIMAPALDFGGQAREFVSGRPANEAPSPRSAVVDRDESRARVKPRPPTVTGDRSQVMVEPAAVLRERS